MRPFTACRLALTALIPALFVLSVIPGCSNQSEGERCGDPDGTVSNNDDCGSGLVCTAFPLNDGTSLKVGRCCYTDHVTDSRCLMSNGISATGTQSGGASSSDAGVSDASTGVAGAPAQLAGAAGSN